MPDMTLTKPYMDPSADLTRRKETIGSRRFIKLKRVRECTALSTSEIYRRIATGCFPAQVRLGPKTVAWVESEVVAWCDELVAQRADSSLPTRLKQNNDIRQKKTVSQETKEASHA